MRGVGLVDNSFSGKALQDEIAVLEELRGYFGMHRSAQDCEHHSHQIFDVRQLTTALPASL